MKTLPAWALPAPSGPDQQQHNTGEHMTEWSVRMKDWMRSPNPAGLPELGCGREARGDAPSWD